MKRILQITGLVVFIFAWNLSAQGFGFNGPGWGQQLTEEQRAELHELVSGMREDGSAREEMHDAVSQLFESWGLDAPQKFGRGPRFHGPGAFMHQLNDEQQAEVRALIEGMREDGASREEIRVAVSELFKNWGLEVPERNGGKHRRHGGLKGFMQDLTDEQRSKVRALVHEMRENGSTKKEIREAVVDLLKGWGIELPDRERKDRGGLLNSKRKIQGRNHPNPFNPETRITYTLSSPEQVRIQIYNISGQLVRTYDMGYKSEGTHAIVWDGLTDSGGSLPSGVFLYRIEAGDEVFTQRMLMLK